MLWEGIRVYSREKYRNLGPERRFILTEDIRNHLHPDLPETLIGRSIIIVTYNRQTETEVEGVNFLVVDEELPDFVMVGQREAERRYPDEMTEVRLTGSSLIPKLFQEEQDVLLAGVRKRKAPAKKAAPEKKPAPKKSASAKKEPGKKAGDIVVTPVTKGPGTRKNTPKTAPAKKAAPEKKKTLPDKPVAEERSGSFKKKAAVRSDRKVILPQWKKK